MSGAGTDENTIFGFCFAEICGKSSRVMANENFGFRICHCRGAAGIMTVVERLGRRGMELAVPVSGRIIMIERIYALTKYNKTAGEPCRVRRVLPAACGQSL